MSEIAGLTEQQIAGILARVSRDHWTADDCAAYFGCSTDHFLKRLASIPSFPKKGRFPFLHEGEIRRGNPRWEAVAVRAWAKENWRPADSPQDPLTS